MCGRSVYNFTEKDVKEDKSFNITKVETSFTPNYNVAPSQQIPVIIPGSHILTTFRWGLIPYWAKDKKIGYKMINARSETLHEKPSFKKSLKSKRCLILASGFYEWGKIKDNSDKIVKKIPHYIQVKDKKIIAFAGLWDEWTNPENKEEVIKTCTIITCPANKFMKKLHDRMPVILKPEDYDKWLTNNEYTEIRGLLIPYRDNLMTEYKVSTDVNSPKNNHEDLLNKDKSGKQEKLF